MHYRRFRLGATVISILSPKFTLSFGPNWTSGLAVKRRRLNRITIKLPSFLPTRDQKMCQRCATLRVVYSKFRENYNLLGRIFGDFTRFIGRRKYFVIYGVMFFVALYFCYF